MFQRCVPLWDIFVGFLILLLPLGEYFVKEVTPPAGYLADETEYDLVCNYEGDLVATSVVSVPTCSPAL